MDRHERAPYFESRTLSVPLRESKGTPFILLTPRDVMKITINVECTPEEARSFMGLPDVAPFQTAMLDEMKSRIQKVTAAMEPETMLKTLFPLQPEGMADLQKAFWSQFTGTPRGK